MKKIEKLNVLEWELEPTESQRTNKLNEIIDVLNEFIERDDQIIKNIPIPRIEDLVEEIKEETNPYPNLSELVSFNRSNIAIMGDKMLVSVFAEVEQKVWDIIYTNENRDEYEPCTNFQETTLWELEVWDVFVEYDKVETDEYENIGIFIWNDRYGDYKFQYLWENDWIECISYEEYIDSATDISNKDIKVIKFLRN